MRLVKMVWICLFVVSLIFLAGSVSAKGLFNIASTATVSSSTEFTGYADDNVKDGIIGEWDTGEWASNRGGAGEWVKLAWTQAQKMNEVWIYPRPNRYDRITDSYLAIDTTGDDTADYNLHVGDLPTGSAPKIVYLTTAQGATVYSIKLTVQEVSGDNLNTGLSEIECYNRSGTGILPKTGQATSISTNDDGTYQKGMTVIHDNGDDTITDTRTGLMWPKYGDGAGYHTSKNWADAITFCEDCTLAGYTDWRLPNINELKSFQEITWGWYQYGAHGQPHDDYYWSSTTRVDDKAGALVVYLVLRQCGWQQ